MCCLERNHRRRAVGSIKFPKFDNEFSSTATLFSLDIVLEIIRLSGEFCQLTDLEFKILLGTVKSDSPFMDELCVDG